MINYTHLELYRHIERNFFRSLIIFLEGCANSYANELSFVDVYVAEGKENLKSVMFSLVERFNNNRDKKLSLKF